MVRRNALVLLTAMLWSVSSWGGGDDARAWLERISQQADEVSYQGAFVYVQGDHVESMRIIHDAEQGVQYLSALNGEHREVVVAGEYGICLLPNRRVAFGGSGDRRPILAAFPEELERLSAHYAFQMVGDDRVAGHAAKVIDLAPRDNMRYGYRLWVDASYGVLLRSALIGERDVVIEQLMFTSIDYGGVPPIPADQAALARSDRSGETAEVLEGDWTLTGLPPGYEAVWYTRYQRGDDAVHTEHIVVSDGLATVSVFVERLPESGVPVLEGASHVGAMQAYGRVVDGHQALVVGEAPVAAIQMIANAVKAKTP